MSAEPQIRVAAPTDADAFLALVEALAEYEKLEAPDAAARDRLVTDAFSAEPRIRVDLAELHDRAVGYTITFDSYSSFLARPTLYLEDIFVLPEARRHGVGAAFFRYHAARAVAEGYGRMEWAVLDWNALAIGFYEKLGARRLSDWYVYRLTREQLEALGGAAPASG